MSKTIKIGALFIIVAAALLGQGQQVVQGNVASGSADAGNPVKVGGKYNSTPPTFTDGQRGDLQLDSAGNLKVNIATGSTGNAAASATGSAVPASADYGGINVGGTLRGATGVNPTGTVYAQQMDIASIGGSTVATAATGIIKVGLTDGSGNAINSTSNALNVNVQNASLAATQSGTWTMVPKTTCGTTAADSGFTANIPTTGTDLLSSATCIISLWISNTTASNITVTIKDKAGSPNTYSSTVLLPANSSQVIPYAGLKFTGGLTLLSSANTSLQAQAWGFQ
jgi:hypothetical protein